MKVLGAALLASCVLATGFTLAVVDGGAALDAGKGQSAFNQCKACRMLDRALVGPPLKGVVGRKAGSVPGYSYSAPMKAAGDAGLTWSEAEITDYLQNPTTYLKTYVASRNAAASGSSKMVFMLSSEAQRKNVVAYLAERK